MTRAFLTLAFSTIFVAACSEPEPVLVYPKIPAPLIAPVEPVSIPERVDTVGEVKALLARYEAALGQCTGQVEGIAEIVAGWR